MKTLALRRNLTVGLVILLVGTFGLAGMAQAATIYVDDDNTTGPWDGTLEHPYQHIQDGVDSVSSGDTVYVFNGTYEENVKLYSLQTGISLIGQDKDSTVIDEPGYELGAVEVWHADSVTISGFTLQNAVAGIWHYGSNDDNSTFSGNKIINNVFGIHNRYGSNTTISGNEIADNYHYGIQCAVSSSDITISGNTITNSGWVTGMMLQGSLESYTITDNFISGGIVLWEGMSLSNWNTHTIENNYADGKPIYYYKNDSSGLTVPADAGQVILANCSNFTIEGLNISQMGAPVQLGFSSGNNITGNTFTNNGTGGIQLSWSSNNNITGNTISTTVEASSLMHLLDSCVQNTISENTFTDCGNAIYFHKYAGWPGPADNILYHNNFIDNWVVGSVDSNFFDDGYPSGGNYWSYFDEPGEGAYDNNGDGIVDSAYAIAFGGDKDEYPLMTPWDGTPPTPNCGDANGDGAVDVGDITYLINYLFLGTSGPWPAQCVGDANCDASADIGDVVFLIGYTFSGSSQPGDCCCSGWEK